MWVITVITLCFTEGFKSSCSSVRTGVGRGKWFKVPVHRHALGDAHDVCVHGDFWINWSICCSYRCTGTSKSLCINKVVQEWKINITCGVYLSSRHMSNTDHFCRRLDIDFQITHLNTTAKKHSLKMWRTKSMEMCGSDIRRLKVVIGKNY
jgi:hypothetical protein